MFASIHHSFTLADRKLGIVKKGWLFNSSFICHSDHTHFYWKWPHSTESDITAVFSGSNNWILLIKLVHKRILLKPIQIINLENAALNSKRVVKICYSNSLPVHRMILKILCEFFLCQAGISLPNKGPGEYFKCIQSKPVPFTVSFLQEFISNPDRIPSWKANYL